MRGGIEVLVQQPATIGQAVVDRDPLNAIDMYLDLIATPDALRALRSTPLPLRNAFKL